jgi:Zn-dependent peptidase ImmA (M78 family)
MNTQKSEQVPARYSEGGDEFAANLIRSIALPECLTAQAIYGGSYDRLCDIEKAFSSSPLCAVIRSMPTTLTQQLRGTPYFRGVAQKLPHHQGSRNSAARLGDYLTALEPKKLVLAQAQKLPFCEFEKLNEVLPLFELDPARKLVVTIQGNCEHFDPILNCADVPWGLNQCPKLTGADVVIIDAALELNILVHIMKISSVEGIWCKEKRAIVLTSLRSPGRRFFTCAHEMAHCHFNHGSHIDELLKESATADDSPEERLANQTAGYLLMPPFAVPSALKVRNWKPETLTSEQAYRLASFFGVSYGGLLNHMYYALQTIKQTVFSRLSEIPAKSIRAKLCPHTNTPHLTVVDSFWNERPVDLDVGHAVLLPPGAIYSQNLLEKLDCPDAEGIVCLAREAGVGHLIVPPHSRELLLRVIPDEFNGFAENRLPEKNNVYHSS